MGTLPSLGLAGMVASYVKGNLLLFKFYLDNIWKLHQLPQWMRNPDSLQEVVEERVAAGDEGFTLKLPRTVARSYNGEFDRLKSELRQLHAGEKELISYRTTLLLLFSIRLDSLARQYSSHPSSCLHPVPHRSLLSLCLDGTGCGFGPSNLSVPLCLLLHDTGCCFSHSCSNPRVGSFPQ